MNSTVSKTKSPSIFSLLKPYSGLVFLLIFFALFSNGLNLLIPKLIGDNIDSYTAGTFTLNKTLLQFSLVIFVIFLFTYLQSITQTYASERVALDLRTRLSDTISTKSFTFIESANPSKLLTNLTADVDSVKLFVSQAVVSIISSLFIIIGAIFLLVSINWKLALTVIAIIPIIGITFFIVLKKVRKLFIESRAVIDWLNQIINESILGSALIRVVNSQHAEYEKFLLANTKAKDIGLAILRLFASLIPVIVFTANLASVAILVMGGHFVINDLMTIGEFAAFNSYLAMLVFPIIVIGFMSNVIAQATASYERINTVLHAVDPLRTGNLDQPLHGAIKVENVNLTFDQKPILKNINFAVASGSKTAIVGPTAAGKTQLLYCLSGLIVPNSGSILYDGQPIEAYHSASFHQQVGFVFQDSILFNMSIRENIAFSNRVSNESLEKAIATAELKEFIDELPEQLDTIVSERGSSLSGGQKQRIMLARAFAIDPKVLLLDDFTARVDNKTEERILANIFNNYPDITLISVTQKIAPLENYEQIIVLMEGELLATGTHQELLSSSPEYVQIYQSQKSTRTIWSITWTSFLIKEKSDLLSPDLKN